ncbi:hypothetical protein KP509_29G018400 [Ceratopteris richardii]|uniref:adenine phosphoribosyltransferase n=1 Tax=Ceratopteris richardii TaxID=49495 RepID=A0A8T2R6Y2_CERRI|nr:hypothetical protein KP509_29G018400 [Ceratopteris richardii]
MLPNPSSTDNQEFQIGIGVFKESPKSFALFQISPKPGILFQDITTLLLDPKAFQDSIDIFVERFKDKKITVVAGIEARGFIFGPSIALALGAKFVPLRKPKKLPGEVIFEEYMLEYGTDRLEMHVGAVQEVDRALVVDDLIATGGTLCAAIKLLERAGAEVVECACIIEIPELKGRANPIAEKVRSNVKRQQRRPQLVVRANTKEIVFDQFPRAAFGGWH